MARHSSILADGEKLTGQICEGETSKCPLCPYKAAWYMVDNHIRGHSFVKHADFRIVKCGLKCRDATHFHCCYCTATLINRAQLLKHLDNHQKNLYPAVLQKQALAQQPAALQQQPAAPSHKPVADQQYVACLQLPVVHHQHLSDSQQLVSPHQRSAPTPQSLAVPQSPSVVSSTMSESKTQGPPIHPEKGKKIVTCPHCKVKLNRKNFKTHVRRKHSNINSLSAIDGYIRQSGFSAAGARGRSHTPYPHLPLSSLHLLVPPLRLMSACMWQVAQERIVDQYDKLAEFITLVTEMVPELLNYKQKTQLIVGLRARLILEFLKRMDKGDCKAIQDHLNCFQQRATNHTHEEDQDGEVEISKSAFVAMVQTLLRDPSEKDHFFKEDFSVQYGARFDTALQILVWEFFYRLEEFLPVPSFSQVFSMFDISPRHYKLEQFASDPEDLKRILQRQLERQKLTKSEFTFTSDTILSTLACRQTSEASEDHIDQQMNSEGAEGKDDKDKSQRRNKEQSTEKEEDSCGADEDICEDDEETDDSSTETNPNSRLHEFGLSPLTSSPCSVEAGGDDGTAGQAASQPPRCSQSSAEGVKEHLDLSRNSEPSETSTIQSMTGGRADSRRASKNMCLECGKTFASRSSLKKHHVVHSSLRPFNCIQCDKSYKSQKDLNQHLLIHSKPKVPSFTCSLCEKRFSSQALLTVHLRRHSGERPFACSYCDKRFLTNAVLKSHVRIHTGERPYACTFCDKKFTQLYPRTVHLRMHKKEKPYLCSACGMSFCSSGALLVHSRTHTGERPYQCESCGKGFATAVQLTVHRRFHTGERPYSCSQCDKSFHSSSGLKKHMRTHTGEKPHQCLTCHKTFSQKSNMKIHLKVHKNIQEKGC